MRALVPIGLSALLLLAAPAAASADAIFDPADGDDLAATLAEATAAQDICYGWNVQVDDAVSGRSESVGSDKGYGVPVDTSSCASGYVRLDVSITWTSESSESEDSASWNVDSSTGGPTRADMEGLDLDWDGLTGDDPDVVIGNAVAALPLLAVDKGIGQPIEAAPETGAAPADAALTDDPGSDWFRNNGGMLLWGLGLLLAAGVFAWWIWRTNRRGRPKPTPYVVPDTVPDGLVHEPPTAPIPAQKKGSGPVAATPPTSPIAVRRPDKPAGPVAVPKPEVPARPDQGTTAPSEKDVAPSDQKDKE